jgi:hypothetical protein
MQAGFFLPQFAPRSRTDSEGFEVIRLFYKIKGLCRRCAPNTERTTVKPWVVASGRQVVSVLCCQIYLRNHLVSDGRFIFGTRLHGVGSFALTVTINERNSMRPVLRLRSHLLVRKSYKPDRINKKNTTPRRPCADRSQ